MCSTPRHLTILMNLLLPTTWVFPLGSRWSLIFIQSFEKTKSNSRSDNYRANLHIDLHDSCRAFYLLSKKNQDRKWKMDDQAVEKPDHLLWIKTAKLISCIFFYYWCANRLSLLFNTENINPNPVDMLSDKWDWNAFSIAYSLFPWNNKYLEAYILSLF